MPFARLLRAAAAAVLATAAAVVSAAPFTVNYAPANGSSENTGATASATFTFSTYDPMNPAPPNFSLSGADLVLRVDVTNTTPAPLLSTLVALAFDFPTGYTTQAGFYDAGTSPFTSFLTNGDAQLNPFTGFDVCVRVDGNNCNGGNPQTGLTAGQSATFFFGFDTSATVAAAESAFAAQFAGECETAARFQRVGLPGSGLNGSDKVCGSLAGNPPGQVPAPAPIALLGLGLVGLALRRRAG